jgi:enamine deaminase RidA (YjgF/YER057c/UK114 family)
MERRTIAPATLWKTEGFGFSHGILVEGKKMLVISGQSGIDKDGKVIPGGFDAQCVMAFDSIREILKEAGGTFHNVVKVTGYLIDMKDLISFGRIASKYFGSELPAQTVIEVKGLALPGMVVEIEALAVI